MGVLDGVADAGLGGQVDDAGEGVGVEQALNADPVGQVELVELEAVMIPQDVEAGMLQRHVVVVVEIVETKDDSAVVEQTLGQVEADEAGCTRYQDWEVVGLSHLLFQGSLKVEGLTLNVSLLGR